MATRRPDKTRDELIVATSFNLEHRSCIPKKTSPPIKHLSEAIRGLGLAPKFAADPASTALQRFVGEISLWK